MIKRTITLRKLTQGKDITYFLDKISINESAYLNLLRQASSTKIEGTEPHKVRNRTTGVMLTMSATGIPQEAIDVLTTAPEQEAEATDEAQSIAQSGE